MEKVKKDEGKEKTVIPNDMKEAFRNSLKVGLYKELYCRNLLSDEQLEDLLKSK